MRQFGDRDRPVVKPGCVKNREVAPLVRPPIDRSEQITVTLGGELTTRDKDGFRHEIALGQLIHHSLASLEIDVRKGVEGIKRLAVAARREISVAVIKAGEAFVEARKFAREIVDLLAFEAVGIRGEIEGPARQTRSCFCGVAGTAAADRETAAPRRIA